jgi:hypothetical protein
VVLSSQREDLKDALYNAKQKDGADTANPLFQDGRKLIPSVTRVFSKVRRMHVYLQAYERGSAAVQPFVALVSFYRGQEKVFETAPVEVAAVLGEQLKTIPIQFEIPLADVAPGQYDCQVTVLNPNSRKAVFWRAPVVVVP